MQDGVGGISYVDAVIIYEVLKNTFLKKQKHSKREYAEWTNTTSLSRTGWAASLCVHMRTMYSPVK